MPLQRKSSSSAKSCAPTISSVDRAAINVLTFVCSSFDLKTGTLLQRKPSVFVPSQRLALMAQPFFKILSEALDSPLSQQDCCLNIVPYALGIYLPYQTNLSILVRCHAWDEGRTESGELSSVLVDQKLQYIFWWFTIHVANFCFGSTILQIGM